MQYILALVAILWGGDAFYTDVSETVSVTHYHQADTRLPNGFVHIEETEMVKMCRSPELLEQWVASMHAALQNGGGMVTSPYGCMEFTTELMDGMFDIYIREAGSFTTGHLEHQRFDIMIPMGIGIAVGFTYSTIGESI